MKKKRENDFLLDFYLRKYVNKIFKKKTKRVLNFIFFFLILRFYKYTKKKYPFKKKMTVKKDYLQVRVRYSETDQMGVVYYGNYAQYFEMGRTEWLRKFGLSYKWMEDNGILLPVIDLNVKFKQSAHYDELLTVVTELQKLPAIRIAFNYEIYNEKKELITTASTTLVFVNKETKKPMMAPEYLLEKLRNIDFDS
jgi:acyl-CoA thioester hydrolase